MTEPKVEILDHPDLQRYILTVDGREAGFVAYRDGVERLVVEHTVVDPAFEGGGFGGRLARHVLDDVRVRGLRVVPHCAFLASYLRRHPEDEDLVDRDVP